MTGLSRRSSKYMTQPKQTMAMTTGVAALSTSTDRISRTRLTSVRLARDRSAKPDAGKCGTPY